MHIRAREIFCQNFFCNRMMHCPGQLLPTVQNSVRISSFKQDHHRLFQQLSAVEMVRSELTKQWSSAGKGKGRQTPLNFLFDKLHLHQRKHHGSAYRQQVYVWTCVWISSAAFFPPALDLLLFCPSATFYLAAAGHRHHGRRRESWSVFLQRGGGSCFGTGSPSCHSFLHVCCCAHSNPTRCLCTTSFPSTARPRPDKQALQQKYLSPPRCEIESPNAAAAAGE